MSPLPTESVPLGSAANLRLKMGLVLGDVVGAGERLLRHPRVAQLYPEYLFFTHCIIRASVPVMQTALDRASCIGGEDPVAAGLAAYLGEHITEERHHDEWLLDDLDVLGGDRTALLARPPSPTVASLVGAQYYWILHHHPVAVMGYIALLEGYPPSAELIDGLIERTGHPPEAFRTLLAHGSLDEHHRLEFDQALDSLPLTAAHETIIGLSALHSTHTLARALNEVIDGAGGAGAPGRGE